MTSLTEVQRIIGLSLNKIQMGRSQRGGLPLHKNLLVATVLNKARDVYMQETMYMNYRLMACGQFNPPASHADLEDEHDPEPEAEDYEEDSESDVEDDLPAAVEAGKDSAVVAGAAASSDNSPAENANQHLAQEHSHTASVESVSPADVPAAGSGLIRNLEIISAATSSLASSESIDRVGSQNDDDVDEKPAHNTASSDSSQQPAANDEGFIDESDCDCDARNFCQDGTENRVPFQYCFNCAPFHPSNGRGPTLVSPQHTTTPPSCVLVASVAQHSEDKLIYDLDSKSSASNQHLNFAATGGKRKRHASDDDSEEEVSAMLTKRNRSLSSTDEDETRPLDDSGYQEESNEVFHPAFRGPNQTGVMEVDQITSLVSIFSFGQQFFNHMDNSAANAAAEQQPPQPVNTKEEDGDSDSDSDTSSDSGHSSDDHPDDSTTTAANTKSSSSNNDSVNKDDLHQNVAAADSADVTSGQEGLTKSPADELPCSSAAAVVASRQDRDLDPVTTSREVSAIV